MHDTDLKRFEPEVRMTLRRFKGCLEKAGRKVEFGERIRPSGPFVLSIDGESVGLFVPRVGRLDIDFGQGFVHVPVRRSGWNNVWAFQQAAQRHARRTVEKLLERERELARKAKIEIEDGKFLKPLDRFSSRVNRRVHRETWAASGLPRLEARVTVFLRSERPELIAELLELAEQKCILTCQS